MPKANNGDSTSRRGLLRLTAALSMAAAMPAVATEESPLISACAEFIRIETARCTLFDTIDDEGVRDPLLDELAEEQEPYFEMIMTMLASSPAEHRARAEAFAAMCNGEVFEDAESGCWNHRFAAALVRDLVATGAA